STPKFWLASINLAWLQTRVVFYVGGWRHEKPQDSSNPAALFIGPARPSIDDDVINHPRIADIRIKNLHVTARFDRGLDDFAVLVHDVTPSVEDVGAGRIGTILANNKCLDRLVIGRRPFLGCHFDDGSGHRYFFSGTCALLFSIRLRKRQRRQQCAANKNRNWFFHVMPPVDGFT